jgi:hypothetical protein
MSLWKKLVASLEPPKPPQPGEFAYYDEATQASIRRIEAGVDRMLASESEALTHFGMPLPTIKKPLYIDIPSSPQPNFAYVVLPAFDTPAHRQYRVHKLQPVQPPQAQPYSKTNKKEDGFFRHTGLFSTFCVLGCDCDLEAFDRDFEAHGFSYVIGHYPGKWFNRDPYAFYHLANGFFTLNSWKVGDPKDPYPMGVGTDKELRPYHFSEYQSQYDVAKWATDPLEQIEGFTAEGVRQIERRMEFLQKLCPDHYTISSRPELRWKTVVINEHCPISFLMEMPLPELAVNHDYIHLKILPAPETKPSLCTQFFESLKGLHTPILFALVATEAAIYYELACAPTDKASVLHQLQIHFPEFAVNDYTPPPNACQHLCTAGLKPPYPATKTANDFTLDPYVQLTAQLAELRDPDCVRFEVLFAPLPERAFELLLEQTIYWDKKNGRILQQKAPGWMCAPRIAATSATLVRNIEHTFLAQYGITGEAWQTISEYLPVESADTSTGDFIAANSSAPLAQSLPPSVAPVVNRTADEIAQSATKILNDLFDEIAALPDEEVEEQPALTAPPRQQAVPVWGILSTAELVALAHFPTSTLQSERLETTSMKTKFPPTLYTETTPTAIAIGKASHRNQTVTVTLPAQVRDRHVYIVGKSGMGKSTLITNMAAQDIQAGRGVAIIDPHGDLVDDLLPYIPPERIADTILFNPADKAHPVTLSPLACSDEDEYEQVVSDLVTTMSRLTESWGHQIEYLFRAIFNTLVRVPGATFIDVHDIIASEKRREELLRQITHPRVLNFWYEQFDTLLPKSARLPILTRMERVVDSPTLSRILSSAESRLNFTDVIENKKIFLARLSKGEIGEDSVKLLGSILTSQIQLAIMRRARISKEQRTPFYLYVDEFQNFTTPTFETILSEARKYQLSLTFAHQFISQLNDQMRSAILGNVSTVMMFALDIADARKLEGQLGSYTHDDVAQLPKHHLFCRPATSSQDTFPMETLAPLPRHAINSTRAIVEHTRSTYSATATAQPESVMQMPEISHVELKPATPPPLPVSTLVLSRTPQPGAQVRLLKAEPPNGLSTKEKILFYVQQAEYLATPHLITLCFGSYSTEASKKANASAILKDLIENKQLRMQPFGRGNVYFTGRTPNPTAHNLAVRDLFVKLTSSGYALADLQFAYEHIPGCVPDLYVGFSAESGEVVTTFWEYDTGTEGMAEIERKLKRYAATGYDRLVFVVPGDARRQQLLRTINQPGVYVVVLDELSGLAEPVFWVPGQSAPQPLFEP